MVEDLGLINELIPLNGFTSIPNLMKIYQAVQKLLVVNTDKHACRLVI
jgi:hypothetical protein